MAFRADPFDNAFHIIHQCLPEVYIKVLEELRIQLRMSTTLVIQRYYDEKRRLTTNGRDGHSVR
jgi:hypothetical protein